MLRRALLSPQSQAGFTLVEVMTVVFIIGLTSSLVILTMPERPSASERAADAFARDVRQASDRAILTGRVQGIDLVEDGYRFVEWRGDGWERVPQRGRRDRTEVNLTLRGDGRRFDEAEDLPELLFDPTGVNDPVELDFRIGSERYVILIAPDGEVSREAR